MARNAMFSTLLAATVLVLGIYPAAAQRPGSETLLPDTTKGYFSVYDVDLLRKHWNQTQLGQLMKDPLMKPFVEDLNSQINNKLSKIGVRLGLTWKDLDGVYGGEVCLANLQPPAEKKDADDAKKKNGTHALALVVDVTGKQKEARELLAKVSKNLREKGGEAKAYTLGKERVIVYTMPKKEKLVADKICYALVNDFLIATDHFDTAGRIMKAAAGEEIASLAKAEHFRAVMDRVGVASGEVVPHARWFVEPLGFARVSRAAAGGKKKRGTDFLKVLKEQGFDAIQGLGGYVNFSIQEKGLDVEILHRSYVYAPPVKRDPNEKSKDRFNLAARMLDFPNSKQGDPLMAQKWIPRGVSSYTTLNWNMRDAFEHSKTLVDALAGDEGTFESVLEGLKKDVKGPRVDLRKDLVPHIGDRATVLSDYRMPITPKSERMIFAIQLKDEAAVLKTMKKLMKNDKKAKPLQFQGQTIWEYINEEEEKDDDVAIDLRIEGPGIGGPGGLTDQDFELNIVGPGLGTYTGPDEDNAVAQLPPQGDNNPAGPKQKKFIPRAAIAVSQGHLILSTHVDFVKDMLTKAAANDTLSKAADYKLVNQALDKLGATKESVRSFSRTDEANRATYELLRQGKMPESETMFGKLLNRMLQSEDEDGLREQQIDGSKLPQYQVVRRFMGPAGLYVQSEGEGWLVIGCLLHK